MALRVIPRDQFILAVLYRISWLRTDDVSVFAFLVESIPSQEEILQTASELSASGTGHYAVPRNK